MAGSRGEAPNESERRRYEQSGVTGRSTARGGCLAPTTADLAGTLVNRNHISRRWRWRNGDDDDAASCANAACAADHADGHGAAARLPGEPRFYQGRQWADPTRRRERRLTLNYAKAVIEKTASYTMSGLSFLVDPEDGSAEAAARARRAERALREIQEANNLEQLEFDNEIDCSVLGDAAYKVT